MALRTLYERFLASPNPVNLAEDASLHYIPTLTTFAQSGPIIRHLESQSKNVVKKRSGNTIDVVEGNDALVMEIETTLEFISGGGAYLPGLENFVTDRIVTFPITHTVHFDRNNKIRLIRMAWDQGSLLSQVEVIGSRGRNWPISDGKAQARLISSSSTPSTTMPMAPPLSPRGRNSNAAPVPARSTSPNKKYIKDPHTSLDLFEQQNETVPESQPALVATRNSAKPPPREMSELFAAGHEDLEPSEENGGSPKKIVRDSIIAPKGAGSNKFLPSRLFDDESDVKLPARYKSDPAKYNHFALGEADENDPLQFKTGSDAPAAVIPMRAKTSKHMSQWDFGDFMTPQKAPPRVRSGNGQQHNRTDEEETTMPMPEKQQLAPKARRDDETHFEFLDDGTPVAKKAPMPKSRPDAQPHFDFRDESTPAEKHGMGPPLRNAGHGLYVNHLYDDGTPASEPEYNRPLGPAKHAHQSSATIGLYENRLYDDGMGKGEEEEKKPLTNITNNAGRMNTLGAHWEATDPSPPNEKARNENQPLGGDKMNASKKRMDSQWDTYDESPEQARKPATGKLRKGLESHWGFGEEEDTVVPAKANPNGRKAHPGLWDF